MNNRCRCRALLCCASMFWMGPSSAAQIAPTLKTAETKLRFQAGLHSPKLSALQNGTEVLTNRVDETPISDVEMAGVTRWIEWYLKVAESQPDQNIVSFG